VASLLRGAHFYSGGFLLIGGQNFDDLAHHRLWRPAGIEDIGISSQPDECFLNPDDGGSQRFDVYSLRQELI
jgi:hypothetical protein